MKRRPVILCTNDDGIGALGLTLLARAVRDLGDVWVVAPDTEQSGAGHSFSPRKVIEACRERPRVFAVRGTPTDCVLIAHHALVRRGIDLLLAGVNHGANLGEDVTYSGTVAAAIEGTILGIPSVAFSVANPASLPWAARCAHQLARFLLRRPVLGRTLLNVNLPVGPVRGFELTVLGRRIYRDMAQLRYRRGPVKAYTIDGELSHEPRDGTDFDALRRGRISITPLHLDMTDYRAGVRLAPILARELRLDLTH